MIKQECGKIDISALKTPPRRAEFLTAKFLANLGKDVVFIEPSQAKNSRTPDIEMDGIEWEIKCPRANSKYTIQHAFRSALEQSPNMVFDLRSAKAPTQSKNRLEFEFEKEKRAKRLIIILRGGEIIDRLR